MTPEPNRTLVGHVVRLRRYPVKSMQGENLASVEIGPRGLEGDRRFAVIDGEAGRVASAKNPRKWGALLGLRAELRDGVLVVVAGDGTEFSDGTAEALSRLLGRRVAVSETPPPAAAIEMFHPDGGAESVEELPPGGFFDLAPVHLLTTATLRRLGELAPGGNFDERRFRPNVVVETVPGLGGFVEGGWVGRILVIGEARLRVTAPCARCVMTTLAQPGLPADAGVLRAAADHNGAAVGAYAVVRGPGAVACGGAVWLE